jgi:4-coumarate--CoA ligase
MRRFELDEWLTNIPRFGITELNVVPMMVVLILTSGKATKETFASVRNAWSGAAPLDKTLQARFKKLMRDDAPFNQVWGMSETSCIATMLYYPGEDTSGSVGCLLPNCDAKLVDEEGKDITGFNVRGELCVRGPIIVKGYFENEEANRLAWDADGYFHTGDVASCADSEKGRLWYIVDRKKVGRLSISTTRRAADCGRNLSKSVDSRLHPPSWRALFCTILILLTLRSSASNNRQRNQNYHGHMS